MCEVDIPLLYWSFAPYLEKNETNGSVSVDGVVYRIFEQSYLACCKRNLSLTLRERVNQADLLEEVESVKQAFAMPVAVSHSGVHNAPEVFIRVLEHSGLSLVTHPPEVTNNILFSGVKNVWPLLAALIIFTGYASVVFWLAEFEGSERSFSRKFRFGFFQAFWYSLVSATTVGYGDLVPKSKVGKVFGAIWILVGICIAAAFTAAITTLMSQLQSGLLEATTIGNSNKVGVIEGTLDQALVIQAGGSAVTAKDIEGLAKLLHNGDDEQVVGIAVDPNHLRRYSLDYFPDDYVTQSEKTWPVTVGFILKASNLATLRCFRQQAFFRQLEVNDLVKQFSVDTAHKTEDKSEVAAKSIVRDDDMLLLLYAAAGLGVLFFSLCSIELLIEIFVVKCRKSNNFRTTELAQADKV